MTVTSKDFIPACRRQFGVLFWAGLPKQRYRRMMEKEEEGDHNAYTRLLLRILMMIDHSTRSLNFCVFEYPRVLSLLCSGSLSGIPTVPSLYSRLSISVHGHGHLRPSGIYNQCHEAISRRSRRAYHRRRQSLPYSTGGFSSKGTDLS